MLKFIIFSILDRFTVNFDKIKIYLLVGPKRIITLRHLAGTVSNGLDVVYWLFGRHKTYL